MIKVSSLWKKYVEKFNELWKKKTLDYWMNSLHFAISFTESNLNPGNLLFVREIDSFGR